MFCSYLNLSDSFFLVKLFFLIFRNLNMLPFEHFLLLHVLINFIRKLSQTAITNSRLNKEKLLTLINFYCGAMFIRPYRPGHEREVLNLLHFAYGCI